MINKIGRRKAAVARIYMTAGSGKVTVNGKDLKVYFPLAHMQLTVTDPLKTVDIENQYDIKINVKGGGFKGQAQAARMAISRALVELNEDFRKPLKDKKYLMRDARVVERKKYGRPKARKSFQFSKR